MKADLKQPTNTKHHFQNRALNDHQIHRLKFDFAEVQNTSVKKTFCCNASTMIDKKLK